MARYDIFANPAVAERAQTPYLLDVQNDYISGLSTRVVVPLRQELAFGRPAQGLNPVFEVRGQRVVMDTAALGALPAQLLRKPIAQASAHSSAIAEAFDSLFGGY